MASTTAIRAGRAFVELFADNSRLVRGLREAEARVRDFGNKMKALGSRLAMVGVMSAIPLGIATKVFSDFDDQMRAVSAVTVATEGDFDALTEKAKLLGRTTSYTAAQVAGAMLELGRAGFDPSEIDAAIAGMLDLARATGTDLAEATVYAGNTLRSFNLPATGATRVCDVLVATANNSAQTLTDLGESMSYCAPIAAEYGLSLEQTAKALGSLANYGIKGSQAGTTLRRILTNLADPAIQKKLKALNIDVVDGNTGQLRDVSAILRELGKATETMSKDKKLGLFKELFGLYAIAGGAKLTTAQFDKLYNAIDDSMGAAAKTAQRMDSGIGGSFRMLYSAIEGVAIAVGEALAPSIQKIAVYFTHASEGIASYISQNKEFVVTIAKTVAAVAGIGVALLAGGVALVAFAKIIGLVAGTVSILTGIVTTGFGLIGGAVAAISGTAGALFSVFSAAAAGIATALTAASVIAGALFSAVGMAIAAILSPVGLAIAAVAALGAACYLVGQNASGMGKAFTTAFTALTRVLRNAASFVARFFMQFAEVKILSALVSGFVGELRVMGTAFLTAGRYALKGIAMIASVLLTLEKQVVNVGATFGSALVAGLSAAAAVVSKVIGRIVGTVTSGLGSLFSIVTGAVRPLFNLLKSGVGAVTSFVRSFLIVRTIGSVFSGITGAVQGVTRIFARIGGAVVKTFFSVVRAIPTVVSGIVRAFIALPGTIVKIFRSIPRMISGAFSFLYSMARTVVNGIGGVLSGIGGFVTNILSGIVSGVSTLFGSLGNAVAGFGGFFVSAFAGLGAAVDWLRGQFGEFVAFAGEAFGAVAAAIGRGDIEAAIQVVWASLKLIWIKGSSSLLETWYWLVDTLQTAWATCVYSLSELLISSWYGVQEFWTETVYTMSTLWTEFSAGVVSAWKTAEEGIARGIGWIMAKIQGLDPNEMSKILTEQYGNEARQREAQKSKALSDIQSNRDSKMSALGSEKKGILDALKEDQTRSGEERRKRYAQRIAGGEEEYRKARAEYDASIARAKMPENKDENGPTLIETLTGKVKDAVAGVKPALQSATGITGGTLSKGSGTFNPFEAVAGNDNWQRKLLQDSLTVQKAIRDNTDPDKQDKDMI